MGFIRYAVIRPICQIRHRCGPYHVVASAIAGQLCVMGTIHIYSLFSIVLKNPRFAIRNMFPQWHIRICTFDIIFHILFTSLSLMADYHLYKTLLRHAPALEPICCPETQSLLRSIIRLPCKLVHKVQVLREEKQSARFLPLY